MKIFISADMEGISGIIHREQIIKGSPEYEKGRKLLANDLNAAIQGALDAGAGEILVNDAHGSMRNIILEDLNPAARLISGFPKPLLMMDGIDESFDGALFIGYHAMAGTFGVASHTVSGFTFASVKINGVEYGETGLNAALAGHFGVPLLAVSGDNFLKNEVAALLPHVEYCEVKKVRGAMSADCMSPQKAAELITKNVKQAVSRAKECKPLKLEGPLLMEVALKSAAIGDIVSVMPGVKRVSALDVTYQAADMVEVTGVIATMMCASSILMSDIYK